MRVRYTFRISIAALLVAVGLFVTACGSSSSSSSSSTSGGSSTPSGEGEGSGGGEAAASSGPVAASEALVAKYEKEQPPIDIPPMAAKPPTGIEFAAETCALPVCKEAFEEGIKESTKELGWKAKFYNVSLTPEGILNGFDTMLASKPDAIGVVGILPVSAMKAQLAKAKAAGIPVIILAPQGPSGHGPAASGPPEAVVVPAAVAFTSGELMGAKVVADAGEGAHAVYVFDPTNENSPPTGEAFAKPIEEAGGTVETLDVPLEGVGSKAPGEIVSYLQAHPETTYVGMFLNDYAVGLKPALEAAGLGDVKVVSRAPSPANMSEIAEGKQWASVGEETKAAGWRATDAVARILAGEEFEKEPNGWHQIFTEANATPDTAPQTPGLPEAFLKAWKVNG